MPNDHREALDELTQRKDELDSKIREAAIGGDSIGAGFRPGFVHDLLKERMQLVNDIRRTQQEAVRDRLALLAKRREIAKQVAESSDPIDFGLLMRSLNQAYGQEMAAKSIAHKRYGATNQITYSLYTSLKCVIRSLTLGTCFQNDPREV